MHKHSAEVGLMVFGFLGGAALAMFIAPGDMILWIIMGVVLSLFTRSFFARSYGGGVYWPHLPHFEHKHRHDQTEHR